MEYQIRLTLSKVNKWSSTREKWQINKERHGIYVFGSPEERGRSMALDSPKTNYHKQKGLLPRPRKKPGP
jgi:hypothetical protein